MVIINTQEEGKSVGWGGGGGGGVVATSLCQSLHYISNRGVSHTNHVNLNLQIYI